jgi:hypothetical protein
VKETGVTLQKVVNQVTDLNRSSSSNLITVHHESLTPLPGNDLRKDLRKWIAPPDPSVNYNAASSAHHDGTAGWCTKGNTLAVWKTTGSLLWIHGKRTHPITVWVLIATNCCCIDSWLWEEYSQVRRPCSVAPNRTYLINKLRDHPRYQIV